MNIAFPPHNSCQVSSCTISMHDIKPTNSAINYHIYLLEL